MTDLEIHLPGRVDAPELGGISSLARRGAIRHSEVLLQRRRRRLIYIDISSSALSTVNVHNDKGRGQGGGRHLGSRALQRRPTRYARRGHRALGISEPSSSDTCGVIYKGATDGHVVVAVGCLLEARLPLLKF